MQGNKYRLGAAVVAVALGAGLSVGVAAASTVAPARSAAGLAIGPTPTPTTLAVWSDTITFTGVATPTAANGSYTLTTNQASVTSDGENILYPATKYLQFSRTALAGTGRATSADGVQVVNFRLVPAGNGKFTLADSGGSFEIDSDGGAAIQYPATGSGTVTFTPIPGTPNLKVTGTISVSESPFAP
jgi:hypothetical protein